MKKQSVYFLVFLSFALLVFASCKNNADFRKTKSGLLYKIYSDGKKPLAKTGNVIKINFTIKIGSTDSILRSTAGHSPVFVPMQGPVPPDAYSPQEIFDQLREGDSAVVVQSVDTILKKNPNVPAFFKKGDRLITIVKVLQIYKSPELAQNDQQQEGEKERVRQEADYEKEKVKRAKERNDDMAKLEPEMKAWLDSHNIKATRVGTGTYVVVKDPGTGMQADSGKYATVRYDGKLLSTGKTFESTMDPNAHPFTFMVGTGGAIPGWDEGLPSFKKGGKGTLYIPGPLGYGRYPQPGSPFKVNEPLVFDIDVVDVTDKQPQQQQPNLPPQLREQLEKQQQQMQQQHKLDSARNHK